MKDYLAAANKKTFFFLATLLLVFSATPLFLTADDSTQELPSYVSYDGELYDSLPLYSHLLQSINHSGQNSYTLTLEDGSVWEANPNNNDDLTYWENDDILLITQCGTYFSNYNYFIINTQNGTKIEANLLTGPLKENVYSCKILYINRSEGRIMLSGYSAWELSSHENSLGKGWRDGDTIIIGSNNDKTSSSYPTLLINANRDSSTKAKQFFPPKQVHVQTSRSINDSNQYILEIEDGSLWEINPNEGLKMASWSEDLTIEISQNQNAQSIYNFFIIDDATGDQVEANLISGPKDDSPHARHITRLFKDGLVLNDKSLWQISSLDSKIFSKWHVRDAVILGNDRQGDLEERVLLINTTKNNFVRAKQL